MAQISILDHSASYEWEGTFWFPNNEAKQFTGKVSYTPDKGVRFELFALSDFADLKREIISKRRLFALVNAQTPTLITLINVHLSTGFSLGKFAIRSLSGSAVIMVVGALLEKAEVDKLEIKYDDRMQNAFFWQKERNAFQFGDTSLTTVDNYKISAGARWSGSFITSSEDIDYTFYHNNQEKFLPIKTVIESAIQDKSFHLSRRSNAFPTISFSKDHSLTENVLEVERKWRRFWELVLDHSVNVENVWFGFKDTEHDKYDVKPALVSFFRPEASYGYVQHMGQLPISFFSFGNTGADFSRIQSPLNKWLEINNNPQWRPVLEGLRRILESRREIADTAKYISLTSEIETFLDLIGETETNAKGLIEKYASEEWRKSFLDLIGKLESGETMDKWAHELRNAIAHPKSMSKKANGKYVQILEDTLKVHKAYAHLSALLLKGVFAYIGGINPEHVDAYTKRFLQERISVFNVVFED